MPASQIPERHEIAAAVGHVAIQAAWLEYQAAILASTLIGSKRADTFVLGQGWTSTYNGLRALLTELIEEASGSGETLDVAFYKATIEHLDKANGLMIKRGDVVHALWSLPNEDGLRDAVTFKRWGKRKIDPLHVRDLRLLSQKLNFRMAAIYEAIDRVAGHDDASLRSREQ